MNNTAWNLAALVAALLCGACGAERNLNTDARSCTYKGAVYEDQQECPAGLPG